MFDIAPTFKWLQPTNERDAALAYTSIVGLDPSIEWQMQPGEQTALIALLAGLRPSTAIEVGSRYGGSMQVLAKYAQRVISVDIDETCGARLGPRFPNAEFVVGDSRATLGPLMRRLSAEGAEVGFVLIDGDHTAEGVRADIGGVLEYRPRCPMFVVMHDSSNPSVRQGIATADWASCPFVHAVEVDFVPGVLTTDPDAYREIWGGLALAVLLPDARVGELAITARLERQFLSLRRASVHHPLDLASLADRVANKCRKMVGMKPAVR